jgi:hypothetical protein
MNGSFKHENGSYSKRMVEPGLDLSGSVQGQVAGCCECGNEALGSIKWEEFLDWLRTC